MENNGLRPWLPDKKPPPGPPEPGAGPPPAEAGATPPRRRPVPEALPQMRYSTGTPPMADILPLAKSIIGGALASFGLVMLLVVLSLLKAQLDGSEDAGIFIMQALRILVGSISLITHILVLIWFYKSAKNIGRFYEGRYPYSPGLTLGLMFLPFFTIFWVWRVLTQQAVALLRTMAARGVLPGRLLRIDSPIATFVICAVLVGVWQITEQFIDIPGAAALFLVPAVFLVSLIGAFCFLRSMWDISVAIQELKRAG